METTERTDPTRDAWRHEIDRVSAALEGMDAIRETADGFAYIDEDIAPAALTDLYRKLCQVGYSNGWLS